MNVISLLNANNAAFRIVCLNPTKKYYGVKSPATSNGREDSLLWFKTYGAQPWFALYSQSHIHGLRQQVQL